MATDNIEQQQSTRTDPATAGSYQQTGQTAAMPPAQRTTQKSRGSGRAAILPSRGNLVATNVFMVLMCFIFAFPIYWILRTSLQGSGGLLSTQFNLFPQDITFANYTRVFDSPAFWRALLNSAIYAGGTTVVSLLFAVTAAYAYSRMRFIGRRPTLWAMILLQAVPGIATIVPLYILFVAFNLIDSYLGLIIAYTAGTLPFSIWMMKSYYDTIPKDLEEAAQVDGATLNQAFIRIVLPLTVPAIAITALFGFFTGWTEYILATTFINSTELQPLAIRLYNITGERTTEWGYFAAQSIVFALPMVLIFLAFQRFLVGGLTVGGVKG